MKAYVLQSTRSNGLILPEIKFEGKDECLVFKPDYYVTAKSLYNRITNTQYSSFWERNLPELSIVINNVEFTKRQHTKVANFTTAHTIEEDDRNEKFFRIRLNSYYKEVFKVFYKHTGITLKSLAKQYNKALSEQLINHPTHKKMISSYCYELGRLNSAALNNYIKQYASTSNWKTFRDKSLALLDLQELSRTDVLYNTSDNRIRLICTILNNRNYYPNSKKYTLVKFLETLNTGTLLIIIKFGIIIEELYIPMVSLLNNICKSCKILTNTKKSYSVFTNVGNNFDKLNAMYENGMINSWDEYKLACLIHNIPLNQTEF